ncbi:NAD(P)-dependent dehydrogenase, short-chain alcohol dehydrogenase family [Saccharopolyspora antimicrobica]|uniref:NAD(P)-dependent dehydrogenase (Short-subunit alcohol dehydrogenase family) n=1 Tax=Saccharopolyspora antimicrobica TaxID=455193 RepID=A0A1I4VX15_9PSEU|nr:SDR family NAD(P)-dependent oxidoreductase [Saccharopolyspora antimicrobica]RKT87179.1 NAD(P)-dependent dehydrogenase (short-subunit alcohol dehydrogenase family) [Saccharopolyspora antimicrobica]SFN05536.1 NAD(P)-dependent dehydrogenase, short-chain alcohol dehydrogenase family [Saccharopolyspora antimicrobica]
MNRYERRRALITGAGSGIGQATVLRVLAEGGSVVAADISEPGLADTVQKAGADADRLTALVLDVSDEESVKDVVAEAVSALGGLDVLVNAAGILRSAHSHEMTLAGFHEILSVNLVGTFLVIREAIPALLEGNGSAVVNFSSTSAAFAHPYMAAYAASKGGIQSMTHALAGEYAKRGIRFTAVQPGSISSGMTDGSGASRSSVGPGLPEGADMSLFAKLSPAIGDGFAGPETVASVVAMLGSEDGKFITGTEIRIDGGTHF